MVEEMRKSVKRAQSIIGSNLDGGRPKFDFYPTPPGATLALLDVEKFSNPVWEPACGDGAISRVLIANGYSVISSDLIDRDYGQGGVDFLKTSCAKAESLITNPPFNLAEEFLKHALQLRVSKIAFLAKLAFLEGKRRSCLLEQSPLSKIWVFRGRLTMTRRGEPKRGTGMIAFAWFVWDVSYKGHPQLGWIDEITSENQLSFLGR